MDWLDTAFTAGGLGAVMALSAIFVVQRNGAREVSTQPSTGAGSGPSPQPKKRRPQPGPSVDPSAFNRARVAANPLIARAPLSRTLKRIGDLVMSILLVGFTLPILIAAAIAVKATSPGPVFYRQVRVGKDNKPFRIVKFRTMRIDAEVNGPRWAVQNDDRVTPVGRLLRRTHIDEIPQAFNIIMGDMSFVGPRPERPEFIAELNGEIPHFDARTLVKPGLTGWAQINLPYAASVSDTRVKLSYDLYYIENYSILLDIRIVFRTVWVALFTDSAH